MQCTGARIVVKCITWPHEVVYSAAGKPSAYEELSIALLVQGYLIVMEGEEGSNKYKMATHLEELMSDSECTLWFGKGQSIPQGLHG